MYGGSCGGETRHDPKAKRTGWPGVRVRMTLAGKGLSASVQQRSPSRCTSYALVGEVGGEVGGAIWAAFLAAGVLAALTATAYSELVTKYPRAAGAALYAHRAYRTPFLTFMVAFAVMCSGITSASTLSRAFGGDYLSEFVDLPVVLVGIVFVCLIAAINFRGISESSRPTWP